MATHDAPRSYALGNTDAEHERLARQAARYDPLTERLFREAGIGAGMRVLDLGSGAGDVAMLAARLVGPTGRVLGVERSPASIARARERVTKAGLANVTFLQNDVGEIQGERPFDALVGRWILMFVPDPVAVLRSAASLVRPGGSIAFHEPSWVPLIDSVQRLPICSAAVMMLNRTLRKTGGDTELGFALRRVFVAAGLLAPTMHMDTPVGSDSELASWLVDTLQSVRQSIDAEDPATAAVGDFRTLAERIEAELHQTDRAVAWLSLVGARTTKS